MKRYAPPRRLLDEPFSALRAETHQAVADALAASGTTALMVAHDQAEALTMGRRVEVLWQGRLLQVAAPLTLYQRPASPELADFVGDAVLLPGRAHGCEAQCALGRRPATGRGCRLAGGRRGGLFRGGRQFKQRRRHRQDSLAAQPGLVSAEGVRLSLSTESEAGAYQKSLLVEKAFHVEAQHSP
ncbi:hypothetical protein LQR31_14200 [Chromobacterium vaccinii]|uniref:hypothetical protein n=1 Tax=Chromobacterium vaccinii TaxID=1108595 RepID=UPI001E3098A9|nr:hypothetical protein [Chromobacterium vaccinii]MCD4485626.1 hypothetical protein [Chromobacterium vaccinii]